MLSQGQARKGEVVSGKAQHSGKTPEEGTVPTECPHPSWSPGHSVLQPQERPQLQSVADTELDASH